MKCRHEYVHPRWETCAPKMRHIVTFQCDCGAIGVRSLGETPDPVGIEAEAAKYAAMPSFEFFHPHPIGTLALHWVDQRKESVDTALEEMVSEVAANRVPELDKAEAQIVWATRMAARLGGKPDRLELNPDNVEAAVMAGMDVEVVPLDQDGNPVGEKMSLVRERSGEIVAVPASGTQEND